ncbi:MAG TPA: hypothetical protein VM537_08615 [Anaerolineae bacterium]|nr:hypothetical protein [Anaerolineae bacterium]
MSGWNGGLAEWADGGTAYLSVAFTWDLQRAYQRGSWLRQEGYPVRAGGPAVSLMPEMLADVAELGGEVDALPRHNPMATFTTRGCVRQDERLWQQVLSDTRNRLGQIATRLAQYEELQPYAVRVREIVEEMRQPIAVPA